MFPSCGNAAYSWSAGAGASAARTRPESDGVWKKTETVSVQFDTVVTGEDLYYPVHSDGIPGNWRSSTLQVMGTSSTAQTYSFPENLRDIVISTGNIDIKITSTREVPSE